MGEGVREEGMISISRQGIVGSVLNCAGSLDLDPALADADVFSFPFECPLSDRPEPLALSAWSRFHIDDLDLAGE